MQAKSVVASGSETTPTSETGIASLRNDNPVQVALQTALILHAVRLHPARPNKNPVYVTRNCRHLASAAMAISPIATGRYRATWLPGTTPTKSNGAIPFSRKYIQAT